MGVILREIFPDGTQWGILGEILPHWSKLEFGQDLKSPTSITFAYANDGAHFNRLKAGMYVVPEVNGSIRWSDSIFYVREKKGSTIPGDRSKTTTFAGVSLRRRLDDVRWMPAIGSVYIDQPFKIRNYTPGAVIKHGVTNYLSRAKAQYNDPTHWLSGVGVSDPSVWKYRVDEDIIPGTSVNDIITKYQDMGIASARFSGFQLNTAHYTYYTEHESRDKTDSVQLKVGLNLTTSDYEESHTDLTTALMVRGASDPFRTEDPNNMQTNKIHWEFAPLSVIQRWGYHEKILDIPNASSDSTLKQIGQNYLKRMMEPRHSTTYTMVDNLVNPRTGKPMGTPNALTDFQCGDSILILDGDGPSIQTVYGISMSYSSPQKATITITLNDYFQSWQEKFDQRLKRLES